LGVKLGIAIKATQHLVLNRAVKAIDLAVALLIAGSVMDIEDFMPAQHLDDISGNKTGASFHLLLNTSTAKIGVIFDRGALIS
jgi:hypothetical protein